MKTSAGRYFYPNRMGRIILLAMEEVIGRNGVNAVLNLTALGGYIGNYPAHNPDLKIPFEHISSLQVGLEKAYGPRGGRGLALRTGRACLKYGLREFGPELGLTDLAFRLLPLSAKLKAGGEAFAALFNQFTDQQVRLEWSEKQLLWHIERCPLCWGRQTDGPCCHLAVGLIQEALYWLSGGRNFMVEESSCVASGDSACTIVVETTPMG
ncbi:MAG: 4-vinyl reductase [Anaerolineales bacterium]|nr:4-vinyl reductase [Anaerolineales bacterium]